MKKVGEEENFARVEIRLKWSENRQRDSGVHLEVFSRQLKAANNQQQLAAHLKTTLKLVSSSS